MHLNRHGIIVVLGFLAAAAVGTVAAASEVPRFDVTPGCRAAAERAKTSDYVSICTQDELRARDTINKSWSQFRPEERTRCVDLSRTGGNPTYTELLTCLEMARDARQLQNKPAVTTGQAPK